MAELKREINNDNPPIPIEERFGVYLWLHNVDNKNKKFVCSLRKNVYLCKTDNEIIIDNLYKYSHNGSNNN